MHYTCGSQEQRGASRSSQAQLGTTRSQPKPAKSSQQPARSPPRAGRESVIEVAQIALRHAKASCNLMHQGHESVIGVAQMAWGMGNLRY